MKYQTIHHAHNWGSSPIGRNPFHVVKVAFSPKAFEQIKKTIGSRHAESGGALFGKPEELRSPIPYIREFVFDGNASTSHVTYTINTKHINPVIHKMWDQHELELHGLIHSHPIGCRYPSGPDMIYFHNMHTYMKRPFLITPIVFTQPDGGFKLFCYLVGSDTLAIEVEYSVMDEAEYQRARLALTPQQPEEPANLADSNNPDNKTVPDEETHEAEAIDIDLPEKANVEKQDVIKDNKERQSA